jgi:hypothetical protein
MKLRYFLRITEILDGAAVFDEYKPSLQCKNVTGVIIRVVAESLGHRARVVDSPFDCALHQPLLSRTLRTIALR